MVSHLAEIQARIWEQRKDWKQQSSFVLMAFTFSEAIALKSISF